MSSQHILLTVLLATSLLWVVLEALWPVRRQPLIRRNTGADLLHAIISNGAVNAIASAGVVAALLALGVTSQWLDGRLPLFFECTLLIVLSEVTQYWVHRWMHRSPLLWRFHRLHHSAEELDWLTGFSKHPIESGLRHLVVIVPALSIGFSVEAWLVLGITNILFAGGTHINALVRASWLDRILVTPHFHSIHHSRDPADHDSNFAGKLSLVDVVFGTARWASGAQGPTRFGLEVPEPDGFVAQIAAPFRSPKRRSPVATRDATHGTLAA